MPLIRCHDGTIFKVAKKLEHHKPLAFCRGHPSFIHVTAIHTIIIVVQEHDGQSVNVGPILMPRKPFFEVCQICLYFFHRRIEIVFEFMINGPSKSRTLGLVEEICNSSSVQMRIGSPPRRNGQIDMSILEHIHMRLLCTRVSIGIVAQRGVVRHGIPLHGPCFGEP